MICEQRTKLFYNPRQHDINKITHECTFKNFMSLLEDRLNL